MDPRQAKLPEGQWAVTPEDRAAIRNLGRELTGFLLAYGKEHGVGGIAFKTKIVAGAFQYFMDMQMAKARFLNDDILIAQAVMESYGFADQIEEPFADEIIPEAPKNTGTDLPVEDSNLAAGHAVEEVEG